MSTHYCKRKSNVKRYRNIGFRARMRTKSGRKIINAKRRRGQVVNAADR
ncbi:MAG: 50S ribosomal protein L34 [Phycisphaerales bacterium]|nr:50S ribosomal protein L34 [Phycisphaerales bacterium]